MKEQINHKPGCRPAQRKTQIIAPVVGMRCLNCGGETAEESSCEPCVLDLPKNKRQGLVYDILTKLGTPLEDKRQAMGRSGYAMLCADTGRLGFQYHPDYKEADGAIYLNVPQVAIELAMRAKNCCDVAYKDGFDTGEKIGVSMGKDLLRRLAAGEISTASFEERESIYEERRDGPLYRQWPG